MRVFHKRRLVNGLILLCLLVTGCGIQGTHYDFVDYQAKDDSYELLHVWSDIICRDVGHDRHIQSIWDRRDSIIIAPLQLLGSVPAFERLNGNHLRWLDLTGPSSDSEESDTNVNLNQIQVDAGPFCLSKQGTLCYLHRSIVPGKTIDQLIADFLPAVEGWVERTVREEFEEARRSQSQRPSWSDYRKLLIAEFEKSDVDPTNDVASSQLLPLERESIRRLMTVTKDHSVKLTRNQNQFSITLPLTTTDTREAIATFDLLRKKLSEYVPQEKEEAAVRSSNPILTTVLTQSLPSEKEIYVELQHFIKAFSMREFPEAGLEITLNLSVYTNTNVARLKKDSLRELKVETKTALQKTVSAMRHQGVPINLQFDPEHRLEKYLRRN